jgi:hypothetical protein
MIVAAVAIHDASSFAASVVTSFSAVREHSAEEHARHDDCR